MQYNARQFNAKQCNTMRNSEYRAVQCNAIIAPVEAICQLAKMKNAIQFVLYNLLQYNTIHYAKRSEAQFPAMRFSTKQDGAVEIFMYAIKVGTMMRSVLQFHPRRRQVLCRLSATSNRHLQSLLSILTMTSLWPNHGVLFTADDQRLAWNGDHCVILDYYPNSYRSWSLHFVHRSPLCASACRLYARVCRRLLYKSLVPLKSVWAGAI